MSTNSNALPNHYDDGVAQSGQPGDSKRIYIVPDSLSDAPNENITINSELKILSLIQEIIYAPPTCYVVSGYRGVGKTSYIQYIKQQVAKGLKQKYSGSGQQQDEEIIFVECNFVNGDTKEHILRKLIRKLVTTVNDSKSKFIDQVMADNPLLKKELEDLFKRTFFNLSNMEKETTTDSRTTSLSVNFIITLFVAVALISNSLRDFLAIILSKSLEDPKFLQIIPSLLTAVVAFFIFKYDRSFDKKKVDEREIKTLYDEEIAEVRLLERIQDLDGLGIKVVFVIDELDKIDKESDVDAFIGELKPILLNGQATFLLITGQNLYYRFENSLTLDDSILPSIFTSPFHVPLHTVTQLEDLFKTMLRDPNLEESIYRSYVKSIMLKANCVPRKFINLIRNDLVWDRHSVNPQPYIELSHNKIKMAEFDSKILDCIDTIGKGLETSNTAQLDFLISQLYLCAENMKLKGAGYMQLKDILNIEEYEKDYPKSYTNKLAKTIMQLIEEMKRQEIIDYDDESSSFALNFNEIAFEESTIETTVQKFTIEFIQFERFLKGIFAEIKNSQRKVSILNIVHELKDLGIIEPTEIASLKQIIHLRNQCVHIYNLNEIDVNELIHAEKSINSLRSKILIGFFFAILKKSTIFKQYPQLENISSEAYYSALLTKTVGLGSAENGQARTILFEILIGDINQNRVNELTQRLERMLEDSTQSSPKKANINSIVIIWFTYGNVSDKQTMLEDKFSTIVLNHNKSVKVLYPKIYRNEDHRTLLDYLEKG